MAASCQTYDQLASLFADIGPDIIRAEDFRSLLMSQTQVGAFSVGTDVYSQFGGMTLVSGEWQVLTTGRVDEDMVRTIVQPSENGLAVSIPSMSGGRGTISVGLDGVYLCFGTYSLNVGRATAMDPIENMQFGIRAYRALPHLLLTPPTVQELRASVVLPFTDYVWNALFVTSIFEITGTSGGAVGFSLVGRAASGAGNYSANFRHFGLAVVRIR